MITAKIKTHCLLVGWAYYYKKHISGVAGGSAAKIHSFCVDRVKNENILSQFPLYKNPIRQVVFYPNNIKFKNKSDNCKNKDTLSARRLSLLLQCIQSFCVFIGWKMKIFYHSSLYIKTPLDRLFSTQIT